MHTTYIKIMIQILLLLFYWVDRLYYRFIVNDYYYIKKKLVSLFFPNDGYLTSSEDVNQNFCYFTKIEKKKRNTELTEKVLRAFLFFVVIYFFRFDQKIKISRMKRTLKIWAQLKSRINLITYSDIKIVFIYI